MTEPDHARMTNQLKRERRLRAFWWLLLGLNVVVLIMALPPLLRGDEEQYLNQHARVVAGAVSGMMLCAVFLSREVLKLWFMAASVVAIVVSVWLASGYAP